MRTNLSAKRILSIKLLPIQRVRRRCKERTSTVFMALDLSQTFSMFRDTGSALRLKSLPTKHYPGDSLQRYGSKKKPVIFFFVAKVIPHTLPPLIFGFLNF